MVSAIQGQQTLIKTQEKEYLELKENQSKQENRIKELERKLEELFQLQK
jgi:transcription elongation GreA/GreB family factor